MSDSLESDPDDEIPLKETLLICARRGQATIINDILKSRKEGKIGVDINCKGTHKSNRGWTPLHLAAYFGHKEVVKMLLENEATVDVLNNTGDTPLHRAAYTGRVEVVMLLIEEGADVSIKNDEGLLPKEMTKNKEIIRLIEAAEQHEAKRLEEEFMSSVRLGQVEKVDQMLTDGRFSPLNTLDFHGNSALHLAAQSGQKEVAVYLLQKGVDASVKNKQGLKPSDVARNEQMKQLLNVQPVRSQYKLPQRFEGLLIKRSTFVGKNPFWVVLERGVMSYFKNRGDATTGTKRKGMKYLDEAKIMISKENDYEFLVSFSDGAIHKLGIDPSAHKYRLGTDPETGEVVTRQFFSDRALHKLGIDPSAHKYRLGTDPETGEVVTRQRWFNALTDHIGFATHFIHAGERQEDTDTVPIATIDEAFQIAQAHQNVLETQVKHLCEYISNPQDNRRQHDNHVKLEKELQMTVKYSKDMCHSLNKCLTLFTKQDEVKTQQLHEEREKARVLQEALHALAMEHHELEQSFTQHSRARSYSVEDDEFFECDEDQDGTYYFHRPISPESRSVYSDALSFKSCTFDLNMEEDQNVINSCDSNASGGDSKAISRDSKTSSGDSNASGGDSNASGGDNNASGGDNNACNHDRNCQTVNKANSGSSSQRHSNKLMANNGRGDEGVSNSSEKSFNWQLQLNGRYDN